MRNDTKNPMRKFFCFKWHLWTSKDMLILSFHNTGRSYRIVRRALKVRRMLAYGYKRRQKLRHITHQRTFQKPHLKRNWLDSWVDSAMDKYYSR